MAKQSLTLGLGNTDLNKVENGLQTTLANTLFMFQLYKKYHWHVRGRDFYQYHLLFDKHAKQQLPLIDKLAERLRTLGFDSPGMPEDIEKNKSLIEPDAKDFSPLMLCDNLLKVHESYLEQLRGVIDQADSIDDEGTEDLLVSEVLRTHELQVWFIRSSVENTEVIA